MIKAGSARSSRGPRGAVDIGYEILLLMSEGILADLKILADESKGFRIEINKTGTSGHATQSLDTQGSGSGKEIKHSSLSNLLANNRENGLTRPI